MTSHPLFEATQLENRLGQSVQLGVYVAQLAGQDYVFLTALDHKASSLVAKNAEHFAFQLREKFQLDMRRVKFIEMRGVEQNIQFWRWRFEWVGASPVAPRAELVKSPNQITQWKDFLNLDSGLQSASA